MKTLLVIVLYLAIGVCVVPLTHYALGHSEIAPHTLYDCVMIVVFWPCWILIDVFGFAMGALSSVTIYPSTP